MADPVVAPVRESDPREPELQAQIEDIRGALEEWRRKREYSQATEQRLARITVQCARMVETWQQLEQRRAVALAGIAGGLEGGLEIGAGENARDTAVGARLHALERTIEHEWEALPEGDERATLAESCVAAAELTLKGFARAEARFTALEQDLQTRMDRLSRDLQAVVSELRTSRPQSLPGAAPAFSLESVMRIHEELRESDPNAPAAQESTSATATTPEPLPAPPTTPTPAPALALTEVTDRAESAAALAARVESLERAVSTTPEAAPRSGGWRPLHAGFALVAVLAAFALLGWWMQRRVDASLSEAASRVADAERQSEATSATARQEAAAAREEAARQVADARQSAAHAQIVGNVLAAPDLLRYWLRASDATSRSYAQVLFSRSRGMVFSASRLPAPGTGKTYQLWLISAGGPVNAGLLTPDAEGRVTLANDVPLSTQGRVSGAFVTLEGAGGSTRPSTDRVLVRVEAAAAR
ncbi:MAG: anti-sigma factor [Acidobacteriota bacterium]|nr:anti-sigma factor [Acidobacteriota bacterium]